MKFTLNRNFVLASVLGRSVEFVKGQATHVPPELYAEVQAIGAVPEDELPVQEDGPKTKEPQTAEARKEEAFIAFDSLALRGDRADFTAGGAPTLPALESLLGWSLSAKERDTLWAEFKAGKD